MVWGLQVRYARAGGQLGRGGQRPQRCRQRGMLTVRHAPASAATCSRVVPFLNSCPAHTEVTCV